MSTTFRSDRAAEAIRAAATTIIREEVSDPGLGFVTITHCEVSQDLQNAKVFYTVLGDDDARMKAHYPAVVEPRPDIVELVDMRWKEYFQEA